MQTPEEHGTQEPMNRAKAGAQMTSALQPFGANVMDWQLELVVIPVSDVDRAKAFYTEKLGFNLDADRRLGEEFRIIQMTPKGSACSIAVGTGITDAAPGSVRELHLVVPDIEAARAELAGRGVDVTDARHLGPDGWAPGPDPERGDYNSIAGFGDPDGNTWILQERGHKAMP